MPDVRDPVLDYRRGIDVYLQALPRLLEAEQQSRTQYDPQRIEQQLALEAAYDPDRAGIRNAFSRNILSDIESGYAVPEGLRREGQQAVRGAQTARGQV